MASVELVEAQPAWPAQFQQLADEIRAAMAGAVPALEHIGSAAVPGLCAKPVLDVLLGVRALDEIAPHVDALARCGLVYRPAYEAHIPQRRYFVREAGALPRVHLHAVVQGGALWQAHLHFRDRLREDAALRERYAALKRELALRHAQDKAAYTEGKAPFIRAVLATPR